MSLESERADALRAMIPEVTPAEAFTLAHVSTAGFVAGGVFTVVGVTLLVVRPGGEDAVEVVASPTSARLRWRF